MQNRYGSLSDARVARLDRAMLSQQPSQTPAARAARMSLPPLLEEQARRFFAHVPTATEAQARAFVYSGL